MTIIPAKVAGVERIIACTPPDTGMVANATSLVAADIAGCADVYKIGGPWAVASMAYGTDAVPKVGKIVGPGNKYVTAAKMAVFGPVGIDSPAGPSEILILADETAEPAWIAMDFFSQIEHDQDAAAVLVTHDADLALAVAEEIEARFVTSQARDPRPGVGEQTPRSSSPTPSRGHRLFKLTRAPSTWRSSPGKPDAGLAPHRSMRAASYWPIRPRCRPRGTTPPEPTTCSPRPVCQMFSGLSTDDFIKSRPPAPEQGGLEYLSETILKLSEAEGLPLHGETVKIRLGGYEGSHPRALWVSDPHRPWPVSTSPEEVRWASER